LTPFLINIIHEVQWADRAATYYPPEKPISLHGPATAIVRLALIEDRRLFITYLDEFWEEEDVGMINIINTARLGGKKVKYCIPQDPGQASKGQVKKYSLQMPGYNFEGIIESGSKEDPAEAPGNWAKVNKFYIWDKAATAKRFVIYMVHVTKDASDYDKGRMNGQLLGQKFIVTDVASENPMLVVDAHENKGNESGYTYSRFLYPISNTTITMTYTNEIIAEMPFLTVYAPPNPTSPQYVTIPIADQGITTLIYETYLYDSVSKKEDDANLLIDALDLLYD